MRNFDFTKCNDNQNRVLLAEIRDLKGQITDLREAFDQLQDTIIFKTPVKA